VDNALDAVMACLMECQFQSTVGLAKLTKLMVELRAATTDDRAYGHDDKP